MNISKGDIVKYKNKLYVASDIVGNRIKLFWLEEPKFFYVNLKDVQLYEKRNNKILNLNIKNIPKNEFTKLDYCELCKKHNLISGSQCEADDDIIH